MLPLVLLALFANSVANEVIPMFRIHGTVTCKDSPVSVEITMFDNNCYFDYLLSERTSYSDGKFSLFGEPNDENLNVILLIRHCCNCSQSGRQNRAAHMKYSMYTIPINDILMNDMDFERDIELDNMDHIDVGFNFYLKKTRIYFNRVISDWLKHLDNIKIVNLIKSLWS